MIPEALLLAQLSTSIGEISISEIDNGSYVTASPESREYDLSAMTDDDFWSMISKNRAIAGTSNSKRYTSASDLN